MTESYQLTLHLLAVHEDLSTVAKMVGDLMRRFSIKRVTDFTKLLKEKETPEELQSLIDMVAKEYKVNSKGAMKFISDLIDLKISVGAV